MDIVVHTKDEVKRYFRIKDHILTDGFLIIDKNSSEGGTVTFNIKHVVFYETL